jgi:hypothetical protein
MSINSTMLDLQPLLQELGKQNPQILQLIQDNQDEFLRLINEPAEGDEGYASLMSFDASICLIMFVYCA